MILVCAATLTEASACRKGIEAAGSISKKFEILRTGMGMPSARRELFKRLGSGEKPALVISSGFAGVWRGKMEIGSWVGATEFWKEMSIEGMQRFSRIPSQPRSFMTEVNCPMVSVDMIEKVSPDLPNEISTGPLCVDMETAALAEVAQENSIAFGVLRMITDTPDQPLPEFVSTFASVIHASNPAARVSLGCRGLSQVISNPLQVTRLLKNGKNWSGWLTLGWRERAEQIAAGTI